MKHIINLTKGFLKRAGSYVFLATVIARLASFTAHVIVLKFIPSEELGVVIYTLSFVSFILPMAGLGVQQGLVRYGALLKTPKEKEALFIYSLKKGTIITIVLILAIILFSNFINFKFTKASFYFKLLSFSVLTHFLLALIKIYFRLFYKNKKFAFVEITYALLFLISTSILSYLYKETGYIIAIISSPLLVFLLFINKIDINYTNKINLKLTNSSFWKYGFFAGLANVSTLLLVEIDTILIGELLVDATEVTFYKYTSLIPMSLLFLPQILLTTDFVYLTENIKNKKYINNYIKSYASIFSVVSLFLLITAYLFAPIILAFFGEEYISFASTFFTLIIGVSGILILRGLFGNLLSAIGKAHLNFIISVLAIGVNVVSNYYFIPKYGILGAAITSAIIMWFTGLMTCVLFFYYRNKITILE